jgi:hypothetical protein
MMIDLYNFIGNRDFADARVTWSTTIPLFGLERNSDKHNWRETDFLF